MQLQQLTHYQANLHILSPVHVGTGQELDPFSYIIRDKTLFLIDLVKWMESYPESEILHTMMDSDNFANIRSFIADNFDDDTAVRCAIPVDDPRLLKDYQKAVQEKNPRNQVLVSPMMRNDLTMEAYIPGSSVKGAIRTAIANAFVETAGVTKGDDRGWNDYNRKIFGPVNKDPMRYLRISDVSLRKSGTVIVESREYPLDPLKSLTPKGHMEVGASLCHTGKSVKYPLGFSLAPFDLHGRRVDLDFILDALYRFYVEKYEQEYEKFFNVSRAEKIQKEIIPMNRAVAGLKTNEALIRIGHFSHVECITLDNVRNPRTRRGKDGKLLPWGVTRTLANGIYPFGWAKLEFADQDSKEMPGRKWPFLVEGTDLAAKQKQFETGSLPKAEKPEKVMGKSESPGVTVRTPGPKELSPYESLIRQLSVIRPDDMGRIGTIVQKIDSLETDQEKGVLAKAVRDKIGSKKFKKYKKKEYLMELIAKVILE